MLFLSGEQDSGSPPDGIRLIEAAVQPVYRLFGAEEDFVSVIYSGVGHRYTPDMWEKNLAWMERYLRNPQGKPESK